MLTGFSNMVPSDNKRHDTYTNMTNAFASLVEQNYWTRLWVVQDLMMAKQALVILKAEPVELSCLLETYKTLDKLRSRRTHIPKGNASEKLLEQYTESSDKSGHSEAVGVEWWSDGEDYGDYDSLPGIENYLPKRWPLESLLRDLANSNVLILGIVSSEFCHCVTNMSSDVDYLMTRLGLAIELHKHRRTPLESYLTAPDGASQKLLRARCS